LQLTLEVKLGSKHFSTAFSGKLFLIPASTPGYPLLISLVHFRRCCQSLFWAASGN
jgi:hypothetical protein